jgi:DNA polymerase/3'-5' exonuclease PolX
MSNTESLNTNIISEFQKLVNFVQIEIDNAKNAKDAKLVTANTFRMKNIKNALAIIKKFPKKITNDNLDEFGQLPGIGKGTIDRIKEIIKDGKLSELKDFKDVVDENQKVIEELESVVGIGRTTALELINNGIKSVKDLKKKIEKGEIEVNDKIALGIKYYGKFLGDIPRKEIQKVEKILEDIIKKINKEYKLNETNKYIFQICGSYRREKDTSGDIDVLISKIGTEMDNPDDVNHLDIFIQKLKKPIKKNDNQPLLVDDITDKSYETKYMGFSKYKDNPFRRIDIRYVAHDVFPSALLYFTGSAKLNTDMRKIAKKMGYKLSEYGLTKISDGSKVPIESEYDVFKFLEIEYLAPRLR